MHLVMVEVMAAQMSYPFYLGQVHVPADCPYATPGEATYYVPLVTLVSPILIHHIKENIILKEWIP
jgi:hypothetical protein